MTIFGSTQPAAIGLANGVAPPPAAFPQAPDGRPDAGAAAGSVPRAGELGIRQRRSWKTWHLLLAVVVAGIVGMIIGNDTSSGGAGTSPTGAAKSTYTPPPPAGSGTTGATSSTTAASSTTTSSPAAGGDPTSTTTTAATGGTPATGTPTVLLPATTSRGTWTSPAFTVGAAPWSLGWAYQCTPAPAPGSAFQVFVVPAGGSPSGTPAVNETTASGQSVTSVASTGRQEVHVDAPTGCLWVVKVTGVP